MPVDPIVIACSCDERFAPGLAVMVRSLLEHKTDPRPIVLYILDHKLSDRTKHDLLRSWEDAMTVHFLEPDAAPLLDLNLRSGCGPAVYFRLLVPRLIPHARVLYLDSDLLFLRDVGELWNTDLHGSPLAAARDLGNSEVGGAYGIRNFEAMGIPADQPYFNSGILLFDADCWRREDLDAAVYTYLRTHRENVRFWDQDGINAILGHRIRTLDPRWNSCVDSLEVHCDWRPASPWDHEAAVQTRADPWIVHFLLHKPWEYLYRHPHLAAFHAVLNRTAWRGLHSLPNVPSPAAFVSQ